MVVAVTAVVDDDNTELITAKSLVTLSVRLERQSLQEAGVLLLDSSQDTLPSDHQVSQHAPTSSTHDYLSVCLCAAVWCGDSGWW